MMPVSHDMIETYQSFDDTCPLSDMARTQAVVNAAWPVFDPNDKSTWPQKNKRYAVILRGEMEIDNWNGAWCFWPDGAQPTRYAVLDDLMFKETE